ncbi:flagellar assembly protein FliW [Pseudomonadota bacterium]|nr:flagellar assembly protein FliW [Pseudomonadota bacterium]
MDIQTSNFGSQTVNPDDIISFPQAMIGLEEHTQFKLFHEESEKPSVYYLQSISDADLLMSIVSPEAFGFEYEIELSDEEQALIKLEDAGDAIVVLAIYRPHEQDKNDKEINLKVIVKSPIIINTASKLAIQKKLPKLRVKE